GGARPLGGRVQPLFAGCAVLADPDTATEMGDAQAAARLSRGRREHPDTWRPRARRGASARSRSPGRGLALYQSCRPAPGGLDPARWPAAQRIRDVAQTGRPSGAPRGRARWRPRGVDPLRPGSEGLELVWPFANVTLDQIKRF